MIPYAEIREQRISETVSKSVYNKFRNCAAFWSCQWLFRRFVALSRLPVDSVLFEICIYRAAYGGIEVCGAEAIK